MQALQTLRLPVAPAAPSVPRLIARLLAAWRRQRLYRATFDTLNSLDDRALRDLGFHRCEIGGVATEIGGDADFTYVRAQLAHHLRV